MGLLIGQVDGGWMMKKKDENSLSEKFHWDGDWLMLQAGWIREASLSN